MTLKSVKAIMIRSDSFVKFELAIMDSLSYSRGLSDNAVRI